MFKKTKLWLGLSNVMTFLLILSISLTLMTNTNALVINSEMGWGPKAVSEGFSGSEYADENGMPSEEGYQKLIADSMAFCVEEEEEGSVLLYNDGALPLSDSERHVALFGKSSTAAGIIYRSGAGGPLPNPQYQINLYQAFQDAGFTINDTLYDGLTNYDTRADGTSIGTRNSSTIFEADAAFYDRSDIQASFDTNNDVAFVTFGRYGSEGSDLGLGDPANAQPQRLSNNGAPYLALDKDEAYVLKTIHDSGKFKKTIVLLNGPFPVELDWLSDPQYGVDACLWFGSPGYYGLPGVVNVLTGKANPSGHTMETYASDSLASPAMQNFGDYNYTDSDIAKTQQLSDSTADNNKYVVYKEGIYTGYKYYETRYVDLINGVGGADSTVGIGRTQEGPWDYSEEVCYPFGFGLSYTTFKYNLDKVTYDSNSDQFTATVTVENTGSVDGKASVQVYGQVPYTDYDKTNLVEKAGVQLLNYAKVDVKAGDKATVDVPLNRYFLASYDSHNAKGYIFEGGQYYFGVGNGAHDAVNAILDLQGKTGLEDHDGNAVTPGSMATCAKSWDSSSIGLKAGDVDTATYKNSKYTGNEVTNLFDDVDVNYWANDDEKVTYLTRNHWDTTFPTNEAVLTMNDAIRAGLKMDKYSKEDMAKNYAQYGLANEPNKEDVPYGVKLDTPIMFSDMKGVPYDDPKWDTFIQQLSLDELAISVSDYRGIQAIPSIAKPANMVAEGPEGLRANFLFGDKRNTTGYATLPTVAASWDQDLQRRYGQRQGEEGLYSNTAMVNGPGANLVRTPYGGRTSEYLSEDGVLNYYTAANIVGGMAERGLIGNMKHCFLNNQETNRQQISTFATEQAMRENYARAWEGAFTLGNGKGVMTSYNRIGLTYTAASVALDQKLFRDEWGYDGSIIDDAMSQSSYSNAPDMLLAGTNLFCLDGGRGQVIVDMINSGDDGFILQLLQRANKRLMYALLTSFMGGTSSDTVVTNYRSPLQTAMPIADIALAVLTAGAFACYIVSRRGKGKRKGAKA